MTSLNNEATRAAFEAQTAEIEAEQKTRPLISEIVELDSMIKEYDSTEAKGFQEQLKGLCENYRIRRVRGDGNCFYRSFLFAYLDKLLAGLKDEGSKESAEKELERFKGVISKSLQDLVDVGYDEFAVETFFDILTEMLENLPSMSREALLDEFQEGGSGDHITWYMRALTAGYMKSHNDDFMPFIFAEGIYADIGTFCVKEVEPMGRECEQVQIMALTQYLGVEVHITYVSGREGEEPITHRMPEGNGEPAKFAVTQLYRPGHYDLLYAK